MNIVRITWISFYETLWICQVICQVTIKWNEKNKKKCIAKFIIKIKRKLVYISRTDTYTFPKWDAIYFQYLINLLTNFQRDRNNSKSTCRKSKTQNLTFRLIINVLFFFNSSDFLEKGIGKKWKHFIWTDEEPNLTNITTVLSVNLNNICIEYHSKWTHTIQTAVTIQTETKVFSVLDTKPSLNLSVNKHISSIS